MRSIAQIAADLHALNLSSGDASLRMDQLAEEIQQHPGGVALVENVLRLFESHPHKDFGAPGPLAHAIEGYYGQGYEKELAASIRRLPTTLTLWLANRIANARDDNSATFAALLQEVSTRRDIDPGIAKEALHFAALHL